MQLEDVTRYQADAADVVIYKIAHRLNPEEMDRIRAIHKDTFGPDIKALILDGTVDMHIISNLTVDAC